MKYDKEKYETAKVRDLIDCECDECNLKFKTIKRNIYISLKRGQDLLFCNQKCFHNFTSKIKYQKRNCKFCNKEITKNPNIFCNSICSGKYNSINKKFGTRRSKLEVWLEAQLVKIYPDIEFHFNRKDTIKSELDIYIPKLKLAFELNGIFHYEPIFGKEKLEYIQNNDNRKFQACLEQGIELCIIDTFNVKYFKETKSIFFLEIIKNIIDIKNSRDRN